MINKNMTTSMFMDIYAEFQGNINQVVLNHLLNTLTVQQKPFLYLLINKEEQFKLLRDLDIPINNPKINIETYLKKDVSVEYLKLLEKYKYRSIQKMYKKILNESVTNSELKQYVYQKIDIRILAEQKNIWLSDKDVCSGIIKNPDFTLENIFLITKQKQVISVENYNEIVENISKKDILNAVVNNYIYADVLSYMYNKNMISIEELNMKDNKGLPLFNSFNKIGSYFDNKTNTFIKGLDFKSVDNNTAKNIINLHVSQEESLLSIFIKHIPKEFINLTNSKKENVLFLKRYKKENLDDFLPLLNDFVNKGGKPFTLSTDNKMFMEESLSINLLMNLVLDTSIVDIYKNEEAVKKIQTILDEKINQKLYTRNESFPFLQEQLIYLKTIVDKKLLNNAIGAESANLPNMKKRL